MKTRRAWGALVAALGCGGAMFIACSGGDDASSTSGNDGGNADAGVDAPSGDSGGDAAPAHSLSITLSRGDGGIGVIGVTMHVDSLGVPDPKATPTLAVTNGSAGPISPGSAPGDYAAIVTTSAVDDEVPITASAYGLTVSKTAVVINHIDDSLDQPEAINGLVNTPGVEDGPNVSPDGQWLIVASYVPIDLYSCANAGVVFSAPSCSTIDGPYGPPERPNMLGASRIHDGTYDNACPSLGLDAPQTHSFFPAAAYMFHRQPDGSFAEPHVLGANADGCLGPYGYSFAGAPVGSSASIVFANDDPFDVPDTKADIYFLSVTLGQDNLWAQYFVDGGVPSYDHVTAVKIPPVLPERQGNPSYQTDVLAWDNEDLSGGARDLFFAPEVGTLPNVVAQDAGMSADGGPPTIGMSSPTDEEIQPAFDGADLYWFGNSGISRATLLSSNADIASPASWSARVSMLAPKGDGTEPIIATGEPTVAHVAGGPKELYFVYIKKVGSGYDGAVARVPFR